MNKLTESLFNNKDDEYKKFSKKLIPDTKLDMIGVRVPLIKSTAKLCTIEDAEKFLSLPHEYYEEWFLHGLIIGKINDINKVLSLTENFLPNIDNWAICDSFATSLKIFKKHPELVLSYVKKWIKCEHVYTKRFAIVILLSYFLDSQFNSKILTITQTIISDNYYVNMALAWFYSVALVKQYDKVIPIIESKTLPQFVHNKAIQKAIESFRIPTNKKEYLKKLKLKTRR